VGHPGSVNCGSIDPVQKHPPYVRPQLLIKSTHLVTQLVVCGLLVMVGFLVVVVGQGGGVNVGRGTPGQSAKHPPYFNPQLFT